jgi:DNA-binding SARP family transcriptional activator
MLRFRVLGPLEVWTGQDWSGIGAPKWRALLAVLLLSQGQAVSTDRLIAELWGDRPPDRAANLVSIYVLRLRRVIGDRDGHVLTTRAPGYQLRLQPGELDAEHFQALAGQGRKVLAEGDFRRAADVLAEAPGLWRGRALADVPPFALVTAEAERLEESRLTALELGIEADLGCGMHAQLVSELRRLLSDQPLREGLWALLTRALDAAGRHAEALAAYGQARKVIAEELGAAPAAAMPAASAAAPPEGPTAGGKVPRRTGASSSLRRVPAQLPADVADFTGRQANLQQLCATMSEAGQRDNPAVAIAVVAGAPGLGKTALAIHAAHALRRDFPDGQLYVSLRGGSEQPVPPDEVLARFLRDLGVDGARIPVDAEERAAMYRTRLAARRGWKIRSLANRLTDQRRRIDELIAGDLAVRACFQVSFDALARRKSSGGADPASLFRMLGVWQGPSIGLRAAAALVGQPEALVGESLEVLVDAHLLESPAPDQYRLHDLLRAYAAERAQTDEPPQAVEEAVHRLLGWYLSTADAAASVVAPPYRDRVPVPLDPVQPGSEPLSFATSGQALHWFEQERGNLVAATRQAASYGLHNIAWKLPVAAVVCFDRHGYRAEWLTTHRIALASVRELGDRRGEAWVLNNLGMVFGRQRLSDAISYFEQALAILREVGDRREQARAANNLAFTYLVLGRYQEAVTALLGALELQREVGRRYGEGVALCNLGEAYLELGRHEEAIARSQEALAIVREVRSVRDEGYALYNLGRAHLDLGHLAEASDLLDQALVIHRAAGNRYGEAQVMEHIGTARARSGHLAEADEAWTRARNLFQGLGEDARVELIDAQLEDLRAQRA